jgi:2-oxoglutarate ferredoxin oxidoreductase subunit delta
MRRAVGPGAVEYGMPRPILWVSEGYCKGCGICVAFCKPRILAMNGRDKVIVTDPGKCSRCMLCELLCPDFAIGVEPKPGTGDE